MTFLAHYGMPRRSGRYPWGSGETPYQRTQDFRGRVFDYRKKGLTEKEIADVLGISTTQLKARMSIAQYEHRHAQEVQAKALREKGMGWTEIGKEMGLNESSVRDLFNEERSLRNQQLKNTSDLLAKAIEDAPDHNGFVDVGAGVERHLGISRDKLNVAVNMLEEEGYKVHYIQRPQLGMTGAEQTSYKVLTKGDVPWKDVNGNIDKIKPPIDYLENDGLTFTKVLNPVSVSSKRVGIRYAEDGGIAKDGVIELRRGVPDISMGSNKYAQVRIAVDGNKYLKGMAVYSDDLPKGVDIMFNTNKSKKTPKMDVLKNIEDDPEMPFKAQIKVNRQHKYIGKDGKEHRSATNIVNSEGDWDDWSKTVASQMLSKQKPSLVKRQLDVTLKIKEAQFDEIKNLTNPVLRKNLLQSFADDCDASAVHLKAAKFPRQSTHVILPLTKIKKDEIFAPNFKNGENVVLIRYPHGGIFEIPELKVNNNTPAAKVFGKDRKTMRDAVGIHHSVAEKLSGADFDGDTVLVVPNPKGAIKSRKPLEGLKGFEPKIKYALPKDRPAGVRPRMTKKQTQQEMGKITNLITDMSLKGATWPEISRAVRHSMVVIDAEKHDLDFRQSAIDNNIAALKKKYQDNGPGKNPGGPSTLISRASAQVRLPQRKPRPMSEGGPIDRKTGRKVYVTNEKAKYVDKKTGKTVWKTTKSTQMAETTDARKLSSGTEVENYYAAYANSMKKMANSARRMSASTNVGKRNKSASKIYADEVSSLKSKLNTAMKNQPLERRATLVSNLLYEERKKANPMYDSDDLKKLRGKCLDLARRRVGAKKEKIVITDKEWRAIQEGAVSPSVLDSIFRNTDLDRLKKLATPHQGKKMTPANQTRAKFLLKQGYTQAEVADSLGVSVSTVKELIK